LGKPTSHLDKIGLMVKERGEDKETPIKKNSLRTPPPVHPKRDVDGEKLREKGASGKLIKSFNRKGDPREELH